MEIELYNFFENISLYKILVHMIYRSQYDPLLLFETVFGMIYIYWVWRRIHGTM